MTDTEHMLAEKRAILSAILPHVPFYGWSEKSLRAAAADAGIEPALARLTFPGGLAGLIIFWCSEADRAMAAAYDEEGGNEMRLRERISFLVRARIGAVAAHREAVRRALTYLAQPGQSGRSLKCLYRTVDEMWYAAGDQATDYNFYTKRLTLAGIYCSTLVFWLDDSSQDDSETWAFLERRIDGVMDIPRRRESFRRAKDSFPNLKTFARLLSAQLRERGIG